MNAVCKRRQSAVAGEPRDNAQAAVLDANLKFATRTSCEISNNSLLKVSERATWCAIQFGHSFVAPSWAASAACIPSKFTACFDLGTCGSCMAQLSSYRIG